MNTNRVSDQDMSDVVAFLTCGVRYWVASAPARAGAPGPECELLRKQPEACSA
jgi:hypothetical protein